MGVRPSRQRSPEGVDSPDEGGFSGPITVEDFNLQREKNGIFRNIDLTTLFHFDVSQEGKINFKEFCALEKFVQDVQKRVQKRRRRRTILRPPSRSFDPRSSTPTGRDGADDSFRPSRTPSPPNLPRNGELFANGHVQMYDGLSATSSFSSLDTAELDTEVREEICQQSYQRLNKELATHRGRKRFLEWLFKFADLERKDRITKDDLKEILLALYQDGIDLSNLTFLKLPERPATVSDDPTTPERIVHAAEEYAEVLMGEYDVGKKGFLTKEGFMSLGNMILIEYEKKLHRASDDFMCRVVGPYQMTQMLGKGSYGCVFYAQHKESGDKVALKAIKRGNVSDMSRLDVEIHAMKMLNHSNVVKLIEVLGDEEHVYLIMELCGGGSIRDYMMNSPLSEGVARYYFQCLVSGVQYCHSKGVCHRDLNLQNLLIDDDGNMKISDFGQAGIFDKGWDLFSTNLVGSLYHIAPEQIFGQCYSGEKVDLWNCGVILYYMLVNNPPFPSDDIVDMFEQIKNGRFEVPDFISDEATDLVRNMLQVDPQKRYTYAQIMDHPWMQLPATRPTMDEYEFRVGEHIVHEAQSGGCSIMEIVHARMDTFQVYSRRAVLPVTQNLLYCSHASDDLKFTLTLKDPLDGSPFPLLHLRMINGQSAAFRRVFQRISHELGQSEHHDDGSGNESMSDSTARSAHIRTQSVSSVRGDRISRNLNLSHTPVVSEDLSSTRHD